VVIRIAFSTIGLYITHHDFSPTHDTFMAGQALLHDIVPHYCGRSANPEVTMSTTYEDDIITRKKKGEESRRGSNLSSVA
jgi:hypothetical protein